MFNNADGVVVYYYYVYSSISPIKSCGRTELEHKT
jgi:hypothetical protein